jgi:nitrogen fixation protein NifX
MRVAFASNDGLNIDEHFGRAASFQLWEIDPDHAEPVGSISGLARDEASEDPIVAKADALAGCVIACSLQIGGPAAAKLVARRIHPLKTQDVVPIAAMVARLQAALRDQAPPWLAKAMGWPTSRRRRVGDDS